MRRGAKRPKPKSRAKAAAARKAKRPVVSRGELERRLAEAREQQAATSEVLKLISRSTFDLEPVLQTLVENAARLCDADQGIIWRFDGEVFRAGAHHMIPSELQHLLEERPLRPGRGSGAGRAAMERRTIHIADVLADPEFERGDLREAFGFRSLLAVPMIREERLVGVFSLHRFGVSSFTEKQIELVTGFADQAVIALENVRLFKELEARNRDLAETLEQQTATADILRAISQSPTDVQPVLVAVTTAARRFCGALDAAIALREDDAIVMVAHEGPLSAAVGVRRPLDDNVMGRAVADGRTCHIPDYDELDPVVFSGSVELGRRHGIRSGAAAPMLRDGVAIGSILLRKAEPGGFTPRQIDLLETFAAQAVIAIENVRLFTELQQKNGALTKAHAQVSEALEQQTATSEILRVISRSQTDVQPVFDTIVRNAVRLCDGLFSSVYQFDGEMHYLVAQHNYTPEALAEVHRIFPARATRDLFTGRAILDRALIHIPDVELDQEFQHHSLSRAIGFRSGLFVPMLREGAPIGVIIVARAEAGPFSDNEIELLKTFADQAVIAVENVRLFKELEARNGDLTEALEQQTATSEILRAISSSPTDIEPVFDTIIRSAVRLCDGLYGSAVRFDGEMMHLAAGYNYTPEVRQALEEAFPMRPHRRMMAGRAILSRAVIQVEDAFEDPEYAQDVARAGGFRSMLAVPMMREGNPIGAIVVNRGQPGSFSVSQIDLLKTFADQAVIAVENVRLFTELQQKNGALTQAHAQVSEALEQQTATAEILRVISSSPTDAQPVFDTIVRSAVRLCDGLFSAVFQFDGELLHQVAHHNYPPEALEELHRTYPSRPTRALLTGRAILERALVHIPDIELDPEWQHQALSRAVGFRSGLWVPMLREGAPIGVIAVARAEPGPFSESEIELLRTFADQAVIAVENVRLFTELQATNRELTTALDQQTATSDILRVISRSQTDVQPVFQTILDNAKRLLGAFSAMVVQRAGDELHLAALSSVSDAGDARVRQAFPIHIDEVSRAGPLLTPILSRQPFVISDAETQPGVGEEGREIARARGYRSQLVVPLLREDSALGVISVTRREAGGFTRDEVELLKIFADQAVIAIENVRLFKELEARTGELTQSVEKLTALGEISRAVSSTLDVETVLDTIVSRASQLAGADGCAIYEYDDATEAFHIRATHNLNPSLVETLRAAPLRKGEGAMGRAAETREPTQVADIAAPGAYQSHIRDTLLEAGYRALLSVPLLREGEIIGSLSLNRHTPGEFPPEAVEVLKTFATQSALAIQNARLFREIADKSAQLEAASRHKSEFLANMSHELRTPLNAIIGFSEILAEKMFGDINEKQTEYLQDILESGRHLLSLINDILDLSKIEAGRMELELSEFGLPQAIENALILVRERASRRGIRLGSTIDPRLGMIGGDERKVKQVLLNLLSNSLKFTPEGGRIDVGARLDGDMAEVSVADTGIGIASEDQAMVFEEFRQVGTADKKAEGTGLGLALSRKFIELHGGKIWVTSQLGAGSTFSFTLPLSR